LLKRRHLGIGVLVLVGGGAIVTAAGDPPPPTDARVAEIHATAYRWCRWTQVHRYSDRDIPLKVSAGTTTKGQLLGVLHGKRGGTAQVYAGTPGSFQLPIDVSGAGPAGEYTGTIQLGATDEKQGPVTVSLVVKDELPLFVLVLLMSTYVALWLKRYIGVIRGVWALHQREAALALVYVKGQETFAAVAAGRPYEGYAIAGAFAAERQALQAELAAIQKASGLSIDTSSPDYKRTLQHFERLERIAASWGSFASRLGEAEDLAIAVRTAAGHLPPVTGSPRSAVLSMLTALLEGRPFDALSRYENREVELAAAAALARAWLVTASRIAAAAKYADEIDQDPAVPAVNKQQLPAARAALAGVGRSLTLAQDADDLRAVKSALFDVDETLGALGTHPRPPSRHFAEGILRTFGIDPHTIAAANGVGVQARDSDAAVPEDPAARLEFYRRRQQEWDSRIGWIAVGVAILTALQKYYLDKPFGSAGDYLNLVLIGLATRAAVDALGTAFDWYRASVPRTESR
jgi:hypothetical protein